MPVTYADEEREPLETEWTWEGRLPRGAVVLVAGWRQSAKGLLACNIAAAVTTGSPLPGESEPKDPGDVVIIGAEDDPNEDMAWRLRAAGADLARCHDMTEMDDGSPFELSASATVPGNTGDLLAFLRKLRRSCMCGFEGRDGGELARHLDEGADGCAARNPRLVIMDPLNALVMYGTIKTDQGARRVIARLQRVAKLTGVTIVVIHHFVKSGSIGGSQGLVDAPRWVYEIRPDPAAPEYKVFHLYKCNVAVAEDLRYRIISDGHDSRIEWAARDGMQREERAWREDELAPRRQSATPADAARAGCKHTHSKYGTPRQCPGCPAAKLGKGGGAGGPLPPAPPVQAPAAGYSASVARVPQPGQPPQPGRVIVSGVAPGFARRACEHSAEGKAWAAAGQPLTWEADGADAWAAWAGSHVFSVRSVASGRTARAV